MRAVLAPKINVLQGHYSRRISREDFCGENLNVLWVHTFPRRKWVLPSSLHNDTDDRWHSNQSHLESRTHWTGVWPAWNFKEQELGWFGALAMGEKLLLHSLCLLKQQWKKYSYELNMGHTLLRICSLGLVKTASLRKLKTNLRFSGSLLISLPALSLFPSAYCTTEVKCSSKI